MSYMQAAADVRRIAVSHDANDFIKLAVGKMRLEKGIPQDGNMPERVKALLTNPALGMIMKGSPTVSSDMSYTALSNAFLQSVAAFSAFERVLGDGAFLQVPLSSAVVRVMTSDPVGSTVGESDPVPVLKLTADIDQMLVPKKVQAVAACSEDLLKLGGQEANTLVGGSLRRALAKAVDTEFLSIITSGAGSISSTSLSAADFLSDLGSAVGSISSGADARFYAVIPATAYKSIALAGTTTGALAFQLGVNGGQVGSVKLIPSDGTSSDGVVFDASQIAVGAGGVELSTSINAAIQADDSPTAGSQMISLWQRSEVGVKANRYFNAKPLRSSAVAVISGMVSA
jgi:hypothetical protein